MISYRLACGGFVRRVNGRIFSGWARWEGFFLAGGCLRMLMVYLLFVVGGIWRSSGRCSERISLRCSELFFFLRCLLVLFIYVGRVFFLGLADVC